MRKIARNFGLMVSLRKMQSEGMFTDVILKTNDCEVAVHSGLLVLHPFWREVLAGVEDPIISLPDTSARDLELLVESIYSISFPRKLNPKSEAIKLEPTDFLLDVLGDYQDIIDEHIVSSEYEDNNDADWELDGVESNTSLHPCDLCRKEFKLESHLKEHLNLAHKDDYICHPCVKVFSTEQDLRCHKDSFHKRKKENDLSFIVMNEEVKERLRSCVLQGKLLPNSFQCTWISSELPANPENMETNQEMKEIDMESTDSENEDLNSKEKKNNNIHHFANACTETLINHKSSMESADARSYSVESVGNGSHVLGPAINKKCGAMFSSSDALHHHISTNHIFGLYYCTKCDKPLNNRMMRYSHIKSCHSHSNADYHKPSCSHCDKKCRSSQALKFHLKKYHGVLPANEVSRRSPEYIVMNPSVKADLLSLLQRGRVSRTEHRCLQFKEEGQQCGATFKDRVSLKKHLCSTHLQGLFHCTLCNKDLRNRVLKYYHIKQKHSGDLKENLYKKERRHFECDLCDFKAMNKYILTNHRNRVHSSNNTEELPREKATCDVCLREYTTLANMLDHKRKIHEGGGIPCEICGKIFRTAKAVTLHAEIHAGLKYPCEKCGKVFSSQQALTSHTNNYHGPIQEYVCQYCGKISNIYVTHKRHQQTHTKERPFKCDICPASYDRKHKLDMHKKTHSDDKEFKCEVCDAKFKVFYILKRHRIIHQERRHKCHACKFASHQSFDLTRHYKSVHGVDRPKETYLTYKTAVEPQQEHHDLQQLQQQHHHQQRTDLLTEHLELC